MRQDSPSAKHETLPDPEIPSNAEVTCACVLQAVKGSIVRSLWSCGQVETYGKALSEHQQREDHQLAALSGTGGEGRIVFFRAQRE